MGVVSEAGASVRSLTTLSCLLNDAISVPRWPSYSFQHFCLASFRLFFFQDPVRHTVEKAQVYVDAIFTFRFIQPHVPLPLTSPHAKSYPSCIQHLRLAFAFELIQPSLF